MIQSFQLRSIFSCCTKSQRKVYLQLLWLSAQLMACFLNFQDRERESLRPWISQLASQSCCCSIQIGGRPSNSFCLAISLFSFMRLFPLSFGSFFSFCQQYFTFYQKNSFSCKVSLNSVSSSLNLSDKFLLASCSWMFSASDNWHLLSSLSHYSYFSRPLSKWLSFLLDYLINLRDLIGVPSRFPFLSAGCMILLGVCQTFQEGVAACGNMFLTKNREQNSSFGSSLLLERDLLLLRLNLLSGCRKKEGTSVKKELSGELKWVELEDYSIFVLLLIKQLYFIQIGYTSMISPVTLCLVAAFRWGLESYEFQGTFMMGRCNNQLKVNQGLLYLNFSKNGWETVIKQH